jgi:hypothetical protein
LGTTPDKINGRIVEVTWDPEQTCWRAVTIRDDKRHPNHRTVARDVLESLRDGIELSTVSVELMAWLVLVSELIEQLVSKTAMWHTAWMIREARRPS